MNSDTIPLVLKESEKKVKDLIEQDPSIIPFVLKTCGDYMSAFEAKAKMKNDSLLREALGDACHLLGVKRKPKDMKNCCIRIEKAIFKDGLTSYHHKGEQDFYNRYIKDE